MLQRLRTRFDAVMIGAGTMRAERYGRIVSNPRVARPAGADRPPPRPPGGDRQRPPRPPLGRADLHLGRGRIVVFTASEAEPPQTETPLQVVRHDDWVDIAGALRYLRRERGIRALLCEGGPGCTASWRPPDWSTSCS